jgi:transcriptional regulator with XRE-family HTH domain
MNNGAKGKDFGRLIRRQRIMIPQTLQELAVRSGVSPSHLGRMERGERFPSANILRKIAKPLNLDVNELFILAGYIPPQPDNISESQSNHKGGQLDPYVSWLLAQEPPGVQRAVIGILSVIKGISQANSRN